MATRRPRMVLPALQMRGADLLGRQAVGEFMRQVQLLYPHVIDDFATNVTGDLRRAPPGSAKNKLPASFEHWATTHRLDVAMIAGWAFTTLIEWKNDPTKRNERTWKTSHWGTEHFHSAINSEYPSSEALESRAPIEPLEAFPVIESLVEFMGRARRHWDARVRRLVETGSYERPTNANARDFEWLARFHIGHENFSQIARSVGSGVKQSTVSAGVRNAAKLIGLDVRLPASGRPAKGKTQK